MRSELSRGIVRLCFGLEEPENLRRDLTEALAFMDQPVATSVTV